MAWLAHDQIRVGDRVFWPGLLLGVRGVHQLHRKLLRCTAPSKPTSNSLILASFCLRRSSRLVPACGVRISRFLPACVRRKLAQHQSYQSRKGGFVSGRYRYAPRPDPFGWALAQPRRSQLLARRRAARDSSARLSLNGSRRSRAPRPPSFRLLFVNFLIVSVDLLAHLVCRVQICGSVVLGVSCRDSE